MNADMHVLPIYAKYDLISRGGQRLYHCDTSAGMSTNFSTGPVTRHRQHELAAGQAVGGASPPRPCEVRVAAARLPVRNVCCRVSLVRMPTAVTACSRMAVLPAVERRAVERLTARRVLRRSL